MDPNRWLRVQELFHQASELGGEARGAFVDQACAGDDELRGMLEGLLESDSHAEDFVKGSVQEAAHDVMDHDAVNPGDRIGPYQVVRKLASGGMGSVYLAERADDQYRQRVAIKVIRYGLNRQDILARFRAERQILANLTHANVARLLDGGITAGGLPYLVMEFVDGVSIDEYCRSRQATVRERLQLFRTVCDAVQTAHNNLIVHRDIKPANILVSSDGVPKLLDFGIAKILTVDDTATPVALTRAADRLMTPEYASPEQVRGEPVTTATDVYALGVLLYELLTGRVPFRLDKTTPAEIERVICQQSPAKPSTVLSATDIHFEVFRKQIAGDLDNIVTMAMRKEVSRRYPSAAQLSEDVRRYLEGFPVAAAPDSRSYRSSKFVRRHKVGVAFAAAVSVLIVGFGVGMGALAARAARERDTAEKVLSFMVSLFQVVDPENARGREVTAREVLDRSTAKLHELDGEPVVQARLLENMGSVYENLGLYDQSESLLDRELAVRRNMGSSDLNGLAKNLKDLAELRRRKQNYASAEALSRESLALYQQIYGPRAFRVAEALNTLALTLHQKGDYAEAEKYYRQVLDMRDVLRRDSTDPHLETALLSNFGQLMADRGKLEDAARYLGECVEIRRQTLGGDHPRLALAIAKYANVLRDQGKLAEAEALLREAVAMRERLHGAQHPDLATTLTSLARTLADRGKTAEAEQLVRRSIEMHTRLNRLITPEAMTGVRLLAELLHNGGDDAVAEALYRESVETTRKLTPNHPALAASLLSLGGFLTDIGRPREAEPVLREAVGIHQAIYQPAPWRIAAAKAELGACLLALGQAAEARPLLDEGVRTLMEQRGSSAAETKRVQQLASR